jgi:molecular chaperone GrpE (heat shock protein)
MRRDAPTGLQDMLASSAAAITDLATSYRNSAQLSHQGHIDLVLRLSVECYAPDLEQRLDEAYQAEKARILPLTQESAADQQQRLDTVLRRDIPALVDLCDSSRRQFDPNTPFFMHLDGRIRRLLSACSLDSIEPVHGEPYDPSVHIALDLVESHEPQLKDHVESCRYRGYRLHGDLLKKAGVVIYR